ncbi:MAG TPA: DUF1295 domain-containing protein [Streptosporangiaceae bacterium]|jgi:steroid 5-alpha reductase family enzyme|nr:DUF1295 domain-containing protein [Streptosporangiaceae bacterium]
MTAFAAAACGAALIANLIAVLVWAVTAWLLGRRLHRVNIIDTLWGPGFGLIAVVTVVTAVVTGAGNGVRQIVLAVLVLAWGTRLGWHVGRLAFGTGKRLLERSMAKRPGYADYMRRTSGFVPLPPRRHPG